MPACRAWDVVKVPFPYTDRPTREWRPALVVAVREGIEGHAMLWVLMITSAKNKAWPGDSGVSDLSEAGLPAPSVVRTAKIATIEAGDAIRVGSLPLADREAVRECLRAAMREVGPCGG